MMSKLLFRFRDLSCPIGETINQHVNIIKIKDSVWWGWWNKGHEKLPMEILTEILPQGKGQVAEVFLFDSGQKKFYLAKCKDFKTNKSGMKAPEKVLKTPKYYKTNTHQLWLKLVSIEEIQASEIVGAMSFEPMPELFSEETHYEIYDNKVIHSPEELAEQNRTIWKIRDRLDTDSQHLVKLKSLSQLEPSHFDRQFKVTGRDSILWLSDLHFDSNGHHQFPLQTHEQAQGQPLSDILQQKFFGGQTNKSDIATLLYSGDLTWKGAPEEFKLVQQFTDNLHSPNGLDKSWLAICPGNHDIKFESEVPADIPRALEVAKQAFSDFYNNYFDIRPNEFLCSGRKFMMAGTIPVEIVLLNSVQLQQIAGKFQGLGYVSEEQLQHVEREMGYIKSDGVTLKRKPRNVTRICVMHHHLIPVSVDQKAMLDGSYSTILDAERLSRWLTKHNFDFLLHGHMHQNFHCEINRQELTHSSNLDKPFNKLNILSVGSCGVVEAHTGEQKGNWVCKIKFGQEAIIFEYSKIGLYNGKQAEDYRLEFPYNA